MRPAPIHGDRRLSRQTRNERSKCVILRFGHVERHGASATCSPAQLGYAYLLTPTGVAAKAWLTAHFLKTKMAEYEALRQEIEELKRGAGA